MPDACVVDWGVRDSAESPGSSSDAIGSAYLAAVDSAPERVRISAPVRSVGSALLSEALRPSATGPESAPGMRGAARQATEEDRAQAPAPGCPPVPHRLGDRCRGRDPHRRGLGHPRGVLGDGEVRNKFDHRRICRRSRAEDGFGLSVASGRPGRPARVAGGLHGCRGRGRSRIR